MDGSTTRSIIIMRLKDALKKEEGKREPRGTPARIRVADIGLKISIAESKQTTKQHRTVPHFRIIANPNHLPNPNG